MFNKLLLTKLGINISTNINPLIHDSTCVNGFILYFSDDTNFSVGSPYCSIQTKMLNLDSNIYLKSVNSYVGDVIYTIQLCNQDGECIIGGDQSQTMNNFIEVSIYSQDITAFWGSNGKSNGEYRCLNDFGVDYSNASFFFF